MGYPNVKAKRRVVSAAREDAAPAASSMEGGAVKEVRSKKTGRKRGYIRRRLGCFGCGAAGDELEVARGGALPDQEALADGGRSGRVPTHLVVTVNGIIGSAGNWRFAAMQFLNRLPEDVIVHRSRCNCNLATFDGVDVMGERLAEEVLKFVQDRPELQKISFVAHSLGGLISRYAIAKLYDLPPQKETSNGNGHHKDLDTGTQFLEVKSKGKIAGLEPMNFITFATPHLGSRWHRQVPVFCGFPLLENMASHGSWMLGKTGRHLFLNDNDEGKPPLLLQMVKDSEDLHFISALQSFRRRVAYANVSLDHVVGWKTSSIRHQHERPKRQAFMKNPKYPHIVHVEIPDTANVDQDIPLDFNNKTFDMQGTFRNDILKMLLQKVDALLTTLALKMVYNKSSNIMRTKGEHRRDRAELQFLPTLPSHAAWNLNADANKRLYLGCVHCERTRTAPLLISSK